MTNISDIARAQSDNWNDGPTGVDRSVMEDLGYTPFDKMPDIFDTARDTERNSKLHSTAMIVGKVICGDCGEVIPCVHASGDRTIGN